MTDSSIIQIPALAWHGSKKKADVLAEFMGHIKADELVAGTYGNFLEDPRKYQACAVGCLTGGPYHERFPEYFGIPEPIAYIQEIIFEEMSKVDPKAAQTWAYNFLEAIPEGADLDVVIFQVMLWLLKDKRYGLTEIPLNNEFIQGQAEVLVKMTINAINSNLGIPEIWENLYDYFYGFDYQNEIERYVCMALVCVAESRRVDDSEGGISAAISWAITLDIRTHKVNMSRLTFDLGQDLIEYLKAAPVPQAINESSTVSNQ